MLGFYPLSGSAISDSGSLIIQLSASISTTASLSSTLLVAKNSAASVSVALTVASNLILGNNSASSVSAALAVSPKLTLGNNSASSITGAATINAPLLVAKNSAASISTAVTTSSTLLVAKNSAASVSAALTVASNLILGNNSAGSISGTIITSPSLSVSLMGSLSTAASQTSNLSVGLFLSITATVTTNCILSVVKNNTSSINISGNTTGLVKIAKNLTASVTATDINAALLTQYQQLSAQLNNTVTVSPSLSVSLMTNISTSVSLNNTLSLLKNLNSQILLDSDLRTGIPVSSSLLVKTNVYGLLDVDNNTWGYPGGVPAIGFYPPSSILLTNTIESNPTASYYEITAQLSSNTTDVYAYADGTSLITGNINNTNDYMNTTSVDMTDSIIISTIISSSSTAISNQTSTIETDITSTYLIEKNIQTNFVGEYSIVDTLTNYEISNQDYITSSQISNSVLLEYDVTPAYSISQNSTYDINQFNNTTIISESNISDTLAMTTNISSSMTTNDYSMSDYADVIYTYLGSSNIFTDYSFGDDIASTEINSNIIYYIDDNNSISHMQNYYQSLFETLGIEKKDFIITEILEVDFDDNPADVLSYTIEDNKVTLVINTPKLVYKESSTFMVQKETIPYYGVPYNYVTKFNTKIKQSRSGKNFYSDKFYTEGGYLCQLRDDGYGSIDLYQFYDAVNSKLSKSVGTINYDTGSVSVFDLIITSIPSAKFYFHIESLDDLIPTTDYFNYVNSLMVQSKTITFPSGEIVEISEYKKSTELVELYAYIKARSYKDIDPSTTIEISEALYKIIILPDYDTGKNKILSMVTAQEA